MGAQGRVTKRNSPIRKQTRREHDLTVPKIDSLWCTIVVNGCVFQCCVSSQRGRTKEKERIRPKLVAVHVSDGQEQRKMQPPERRLALVGEFCNHNTLRLRWNMCGTLSILRFCTAGKRNMRHIAIWPHGMARENARANKSDYRVRYLRINVSIRPFFHFGASHSKFEHICQRCRFKSATLSFYSRVSDHGRHHGFLVLFLFSLSVCCLAGVRVAWNR